MNYLDEEIYFDEQDVVLVSNDDQCNIEGITTFKDVSLNTGTTVINVTKLCAKVIVNGVQTYHSKVVNSLPIILENFSNLKEVEIEKPFIGKVGTKERFIQLGKVIHYIDSYLNEITVIIDSE